MGDGCDTPRSCFPAGKLIGSAEAEKLRAALERRAGGEPVHRIMGQREFYGLPFRLSAQTLEPRPDTEALVELVIPVLEQLIARHGYGRGAGYGLPARSAIIISLLHRFEHMHGIGVDVAEGALCHGANQRHRQWRWREGLPV